MAGEPSRSAAGGTWSVNTTRHTTVELPGLLTPGWCRARPPRRRRPALDAAQRALTEVLTSAGADDVATGAAPSMPGAVSWSAGGTAAPPRSRPSPATRPSNACGAAGGAAATGSRRRTDCSPSPTTRRGEPPTGAHAPNSPRPSPPTNRPIADCETHRKVAVAAAKRMADTVHPRLRRAGEGDGRRHRAAARRPPSAGARGRVGDDALGAARPRPTVMPPGAPRTAPRRRAAELGGTAPDAVAAALNTTTHPWRDELGRGARPRPRSCGRSPQP